MPYDKYEDAVREVILKASREWLRMLLVVAREIDLMQKACKLDPDSEEGAHRQAASDIEGLRKEEKEANDTIYSKTASQVVSLALEFRKNKTDATLLMKNAMKSVMNIEDEFRKECFQRITDAIKRENFLED